MAESYDAFVIGARFALYARQLAEQEMQSDVVLREEWARGPQHRSRRGW